MHNGCAVPNGKVVDYYKDVPEDDEEAQEKIPYKDEAEYIVYDASQVRMRYLIQVSSW